MKEEQPSKKAFTCGECDDTREEACKIQLTTKPWAQAAGKEQEKKLVQKKKEVEGRKKQNFRSK